MEILFPVITSIATEYRFADVHPRVVISQLKNCVYINPMETANLLA